MGFYKGIFNTDGSTAKETESAATQFRWEVDTIQTMDVHNDERY